VAGPINDITVSRQIYYQLIQLSLIRISPPQLTDPSPPQPKENQLTLSEQSRQTALTHTPRDGAGNTGDALLRQFLNVTIEDTTQSPTFFSASLTQADQALQAYAQASEPDITIKNTISIFV
jgi:hypothetical protein